MYGRYGIASPSNFYFEAGRRCDTGEGLFNFRLKPPADQQAVELLDRYTAALVSTISPSQAAPPSHVVLSEPPPSYADEPISLRPVAAAAAVIDQTPANQYGSIQPQVSSPRIAVEKGGEAASQLQYQALIDVQRVRH